MPKKTEKRDLYFTTSILSQNYKKIVGGLFGEKVFFPKQSLALPIKLEGLTSLPVRMLRGKIEKTFLVQFPRPNGSI